MSILMTAAQRALVLTAVTAATATWSQTASTAAKADEAEAAAAMQRAQRQAANPMRVILEAGKFKRAGTGSEQSSPAAPAVALASAPAVGLPPPQPPSAQPQPQPQPPLLVTASTLAGAAGPAEVPALERMRNAEAAAPLPDLPQAAAPPALTPDSAAPPKLLTSVPPVFSGRLAEDAARLTGVIADLNLRADGSVAGVAVLGGVPRALQRPIVEALEQWRFEPLPAARTHRVQLVFRAAP